MEVIAGVLLEKTWEAVQVKLRVSIGRVQEEITNNVLGKASWPRMQNQNLRSVPLQLDSCVILGQLPLCASVSISINRDC